MKNKADWASKAMSYIYGASVPVQPAKQEPKQKYEKPAVFNNEEASKNLRKQNKKRDDAAMAAIKSRLNQGTKRRHGGAVEVAPTPEPTPTCVYALDEVLAAMQALEPSVTAALTMSESYQKGSFTIAGTSNHFGAFPSNALAAIKDFSTGIHVFEFSVDVPDITFAAGSGTDWDIFELRVLDISTGGTLAFTLNVDQRNPPTYTHRLGIVSSTWVGVTEYVDITAYKGTTIRVGVEVNATAGTFSVTVAGTTAVFADNTQNLSSSTIFLMYGDDGTHLSSNIGEVVAYQLYTDRAAYTGTYTSGALDVCGNTING